MKATIIPGVPPGISMFIDSLCLLPQIKTQAKIVYSWLDLRQVPREPRRRKYICHCINQAYHELGIDEPDPREICAVVGIDSIAGCATINNKLKYKRGITPSSPTTDPSRLLVNYASKILSLNDNIVSGMSEVFSRFLVANQWCLAYQVRDMISCFIVCYLSIGGYDFDLKDIICAIGTEQVKVMFLYSRMEAGVAAA